MERRQLLKMTSMMIGGALTAPLISAVLSGCHEVKLDPTAQLKLLDDQQIFFLNKIVQTILPESEIPGAISVGVPQMIDHMVAVTYAPQKQMEFIRGLNITNKLWHAKPLNFSKSKVEDQLNFLKDFEAGISERVAERKKSEVEKKESITVTDDFSAEAKPLEEENLTIGEQSEIADNFYTEVKQQTIAYYLASEEISTKYLNYLPVPGEYKACIPLSEVGGKAWAI